MSTAGESLPDVLDLLRGMGGQLAHGIGLVSELSRRAGISGRRDRGVGHGPVTQTWREVSHYYLLP